LSAPRLPSFISGQTQHFLRPYVFSPEDSPEDSLQIENCTFYTSHVVSDLKLILDTAEHADSENIKK
jgi:hypothetical protein